MSPRTEPSASGRLAALAAATLLASVLTYAAPVDPPSGAAAAAAGAAPAAASSVRAAGVTLPLAAATPPNPDAGDRGRLDRTIRFLQDAQNADGGFSGSVGGASDPLFTAWVALALAAGGVNPQDQRQPGGISAYDYLTAHAAQLSVTTDFERVLMVALAAGADPRNFGGRDLVGTILARQLPDGSFPYAEESRVGALNATAFAVIPLSVFDEPAIKRAVDRACEWLIATQQSSGSWVGNADLTASVIEALRAAGRQGTRAEAAAWNYLREQAFVPADGGFNEGDGGPEANSASTAWTVQGMWAAGIEPRTWLNASPGPLDFLATMQDPATGAVRWKASANVNPVWMTAYAAPAFAGYPLPIPAVARAAKVEEPETADSGVTSGGGGRGAPNFSRPEPQSQGTTTGGVRDTTQRQEDQGSTRQRSEDASEQQRTTSASNGASDAGVTRDVGAPAAARGPGKLEREQPAEAPATGEAGAAPQVAGTVVSAARGGADGSAQLATEAIAPGLISADQRRAGSLAAGLGSALALCLLLGMKIERDQLGARP